MSDFEDYAYSPYDDIEDLLYDADPAPELADDLAEHAVHSPVYEGETAGSELQDYFSDWEYYSDDYVDDDPVLLRKNPQDGSSLKQPLKKTGDQTTRPKRGKKRKLAEATDNTTPSVEETDLISRCIRGTVWANPTTRGPPAYKEGQEGKVALMKNWRQVFAITDSGWGRHQQDLTDDESWAKDMSLEDMGLKNVQGPPVDQGPGPQETVYDEDLQDDGEDHEGETEQIAPDDSPSNAFHVKTEGISDDELPRKRRRLKPDISSPARASLPVVVETEEIKPRTPKSKLSIGETVDKPPDTTAANDNKAGTVKVPAVNGLSLSGGRKRKAVEDAYVEEAGHLKSTGSSRAKRVASTTPKSNSAAPVVTRQTRNGKK